MNRRIKGIPNNPRFGLLYQLIKKLIIDPFLNENTRTSNTDLPLQMIINECIRIN